MSIFKKASELNKLPGAVENAYFDNTKIEEADEFEELLKTASSKKSTYDSRVTGFKKTASSNPYEFSQPKPANYSEAEGGITRVGYGKRFNDEKSEMFGQEPLKSFASNQGLSIWDPEFDVLKDGFSESQDQDDSIFDRRTMFEKKAAAKQQWESEAKSNIRKQNILPHRGLGIVRTSNDMPIHHNNINSVNEFYAEAQDGIRGLIKKSNEERKAQISRQGVSPEEARAMWEKEAVAARTMEAMQNNSFLDKFAQGFTFDE